MRYDNSSRYKEEQANKEIRRQQEAAKKEVREGGTSYKCRGIKYVCASVSMFLRSWASGREQHPITLVSVFRWSESRK